MNVSKAVLLIFMGVASAVLVSRIVQPAQAAFGSVDFTVATIKPEVALVLDTTSGRVRFCFMDLSDLLSKPRCTAWSD